MKLAFAIVAVAFTGLATADQTVDVQNDATFTIPESRGPVCIGAGNTPYGTACPLKGDIASANCHILLPSFNGVECVAPADATCTQIGTIWTCAFPQTTVGRDWLFSGRTPRSTTGSPPMQHPTTPPPSTETPTTQPPTTEYNPPPSTETPTTQPPTTEYTPPPSTETPTTQPPTTGPPSNTCSDSGPNMDTDSVYSEIGAYVEHTSSYRDCCEKCHETGGCFGFTYSTADGGCRLTSNIDASNLSPNPGLHSGHFIVPPPATETPTTGNACSNAGPNMATNSVYSEIGAYVEHTSSYRDCCEKCHETGGCFGFTYSTADGGCRLTSNIDASNLSPNPGLHSGHFIAPSPTTGTPTM